MLKASTGGAHTLFSASDPTVYSVIEFDITDIVKAWYLGEPNYGLVLVPLAGSDRTETSGWKYTEQPPTAVSVVGNHQGQLSEVTSDTGGQTMRIVIILE